MLREMLLNENSENREVYSAAEQKELIFQLFRLFAVGGELCQPETEIGRLAIIFSASCLSDCYPMQVPDTDQGGLQGYRHSVQVCGHPFFEHCQLCMH